MMDRRLTAFCASVALIGALAAGYWWMTLSTASLPDEAPLPVPPFPPRIAEGATYEGCLATLASDPASALSIAEAWQATGGGDGAQHCHGLALIAVGKPADGAAMLEQLAQQGSAPVMGRALLLGQAVQARLMVGQADKAADDATAALALTPDDTDLFIMRAAAESIMNRYDDAVTDLNRAVLLDGTRSDALVARAVMRRRMNKLDLAQADVSRALVLDPDNADALLERGILRQRMGDAEGARSDWEHARGVDPNSTTADLAAQNLALLEAGPRER